MVDWALRDEIDFDPYDDAIDIATRKLLGKVVAQREAALAALPVGARLCVHDDPVTSSEGFDFRSDIVKYTVRQRAHTLMSGEQCGYAGTRTEYGPRSDKAERLNQKTLDQLRAMSPDRCCQAGRVSYPDVCPWHGEQSAPTITANVLTAHLPLAGGPCPECGKPARYNLAADAILHDDANDHAACSHTVLGTEASERYTKMLDGLLALPFEPPVPGIFSTAQAQWAASDDEPPEALYDKLHEMFKRVSTPPPRPPVSPDTVRRSQEAAGMPRAPWIAIKASLDEPDVTAFWMQPEPAAETYAVNAGIAPALWGVPLYRTGTYLARPAAEGGGWDVAEVMVTQ
jgi:hypothetical protein